MTKSNNKNASKPPKGAKAMLGFAATYMKPRTTAEWMKELREGETDAPPSRSDP